jgi:hypothetical protein
VKTAPPLLLVVVVCGGGDCFWEDSFVGKSRLFAVFYCDRKELPSLPPDFVERCDKKLLREFGVVSSRALMVISIFLDLLFYSSS